MNILKQSTAATIKLGPMIDDTDGKTAETALTIAQADIRLSKNGGDMAQTNNTAGATHDELGYYNVPLDATDTNTLGRLLVAVHESGALPVWKEFLVVTANVYDTLCSTDSLDVNVATMAADVITSSAFDESTAFPLKSADTGSTQVARVGADSDTLETLSDQLDAVKTETAAILIDTGTTLDGNITAILADTNEVQAELADGGRTDLLIDAIKAKTDTITAAPTAGDVADAVWDEAISGHTTATTFGGKNQKVVPSETINDYKADVSALATAAALTTVDNEVGVIDGIVDAIKLKTDNLPADPADDSDIDAQLAAIKAETALIVADTGTDIPATLATLALESTLTAMKGAGWTTETLVTLKAYVDEIETRLTAARAGYLDKLNVTGTLAHSDAAATYKADVSGLAPANEYDAKLSAIQADLDNPAQYRADVSELATQESVNAIPTTPLLAANYTAPDNAGIGAIKTKTDQLTFTTLNKVDASATIDPTGLATSADLAVVDANVDEIKAKTDQLAFSVPNRVDASATVDPTGIATSEELAALDDKIDSIKSKTDLMDASSITITPTVIGSKITVLRGDTFIADVAGLGSLAAYVTLDFTVKHSTNQSDDNAIIRIRKNADGLSDGLLRLNGAAYPTGGDGSLTITDEAAGDVMIMLKEDVTDDLLPGTYVYDIQLIEANEVSTLTSGTLIVSADVTRLVE